MKKIVSILIFTLCGCAPSLPDTANIFVEPVNIVTLEKRDFTRVSVEQFTDSRSSDEVIEVAGRLIRSESSIATAAQGAFSEALRASGIQVVLFDGDKKIKGEVLQWKAFVKPQMPLSSVEARAKILIEVINSDNQAIFRGTFSGESFYEHPFLNTSHIENALSEAMRIAIEEVFKSDKFSSVLL